MPLTEKTACEGPRGPGKRSKAHAKLLWAERSGRGPGGPSQEAPKRQPPSPRRGSFDTQEGAEGEGGGATGRGRQGRRPRPPRGPAAPEARSEAEGPPGPGSARPEGTHSREWAGTAKRNGHPAKGHGLAFVRGLEPKGGKPPLGDKRLAALALLEPGTPQHPFTGIQV